MDKKIYVVLLITIVAIWFIAPMITGANFAGSELVTLISVYFIGGYFKKFPSNKITPKFSKIFLAIILSCYILICGVLLFLGQTIASLSFLTTVLNLVKSKNSIFTLLVSVVLFLVTLTSKPRYSEFVNFISASTLSIYLIHDNVHFKDYMWNSVFKVQDLAKSNLLILNLLWVSMAILVGCLIIDILRRYLLEKPIFYLLDKPISSVENFFLRKLNSL